MNSSTNPDYLRHHQYRETGNLQARMDLHGQYSTSAEPFWVWVFDRMDLAPDAEILEVGGGVGGFWLANAERIPPGWRVTMSDLSAGMVEAARTNLAGLPQIVDYLEADVRALPFPDASFDAVMANFMLYHLPDRRPAIAELARVLRPGGRLFAATNGSAHLREIRNLEARFRIETLFGATSSAQAFGLQNGAAQLETDFAEVTVERHEDSLRVPSADPIIAHIRSKLTDRAAAASKLEAVRTHLERLIGEQGSFMVTKASGLFTAVRR
ncbi:MAG TPA: hypothetical protein DCZ72_00990 [Armatimonadetes bacterium]|nr:hypothetical protein [Armatimonadota bacterium]